MIVELAGCTGAGKSTVAHELRARLAPHLPVWAPSDFLPRVPGLGSLSHPTAHNLVQEMASARHFAGALDRHAPFVRYVAARIRTDAGLGLRGVRYLRSLERTLGVHACLRSTPIDGIVLVDEGPLVAAHNLFVFGDAVHSEELGRFASLVPLADAIVHVTAPVESIVARTFARPDAPRELRRQSREAVTARVRRALSVYDALLSIPRLRPRVLALEWGDQDQASRLSALDRVAADLVARQAACDHGIGCAS